VATWLLICLGLIAALLCFFVALALLDPDASPTPLRLPRRRSRLSPDRRSHTI
jgi:hypothetical protein